MVLEFSVAKFMPGKGLEMTRVPRDEGQNYREYREKANKLAAAMRDKLGQTGMIGSVNVLTVDARSPEEMAASRAQFIESGVTPAELPTTRDIVAAAGLQELPG